MDTFKIYFTFNNGKKVVVFVQDTQMTAASCDGHEGRIDQDELFDLYRRCDRFVICK